MSDKKKFGLVMPKKAETLKMRTNSVFNDDDSDTDVVTAQRPKIPQKKIELMKKKEELLEDPSIYEYDTIYDEMKSKQAEKLAPKEKKNSRYIETLLKAADKRKKEYERRMDKKIQLEREKEGDKYKDKEAFVTSAYKKKMQEREEEEERERRENMLNEMMDVTKQKDLSGFYRHFLNQTVGEENIPVFGEREIKKEIDSDQDVPADKVSEKIDEVDVDIDRDSDGIEIDNDDGSERSEKSSDKEDRNIKESRKRSREYRKHRSKHEDQASEVSNSPGSSRKRPRKSSKNSNLNAKSDSDSEAEKDGDESSSLLEHRNAHKNRKVNARGSRHDSSSDDEKTDHKSSNGDAQNDTTQSKDAPKVSIYTKRTVGNVFTEAQARYFKRMAERSSKMQ